MTEATYGLRTWSARAVAACLAVALVGAAACAPSPPDSDPNAGPAARLGGLSSCGADAPYVAVFDGRVGDYDDPAGKSDVFGLTAEGLADNVTQGVGGGWTRAASLSADGRLMAFLWGPAKVVGGGPVPPERLYLRDLASGIDTCY